MISLSCYWNYICNDHLVFSKIWESIEIKSVNAQKANNTILKGQEQAQDYTANKMYYQHRHQQHQKCRAATLLVTKAIQCDAKFRFNPQTIQFVNLY